MSRFFLLETQGDPQPGPNEFWFWTTKFGTFTYRYSANGTFSITIDWGDGSPPDTNTSGGSMSHRYPDNSEKLVKVTVNDWARFFTIGLESEDVTAFNAKNVQHITSWDFWDNPNLDSNRCTWPENQISVTNFRFYRTGMREIDVRWLLLKNQGQFSVAQCPNLETVHFNPGDYAHMETPTAYAYLVYFHLNPNLRVADFRPFRGRPNNANYTRYYAYGCPLLTDIHFVSNPDPNEHLYGGRFYQNESLTSFSWPFQESRYLDLGECDNLTSLNILGTDVRIQFFSADRCPLLTQVNGLNKIIGGVTGYNTASANPLWTKTSISMNFTYSGLTSFTLNPNFESASALFLVLRGNNIQSPLDLTMVEYFYGVFDIRDNPNMGGYTVSPTASADVTSWIAHDIGAVGTMDLSCVHQIGMYQASGGGPRGNLNFTTNPLLTAVTLPPASANPKWNLWQSRPGGERYQACLMLTECAVTELDLSDIQGSGLVRIYSDVPLTKFVGFGSRLLTSPTQNYGNFQIEVSTSTCTHFDAGGHTHITILVLTGFTPTTFILPTTPQVEEFHRFDFRTMTFPSTTLDLASIFPNVRSAGLGNQRCYITNLVSLTLPGLDLNYDSDLDPMSDLEEFDVANFVKLTASAFDFVYLRDARLNAVSVDRFLVKLDAVVVGTQTSGARRVWMNGGSNSAPTDGSVTGFDGISAKASLIAKGLDVLTN